MKLVCLNQLLKEGENFLKKLKEEKDSQFKNIESLYEKKQEYIDLRKKEYLDHIQNFENMVKNIKKDIEVYNKEKKEKENIIKKRSTNPYGYYGKFNQDKFCIAEVDEDALKAYEETGDARLLKTGVQCDTGQYQKPGLLKLLINVFKIEIPPLDRVDIPNNKKYWEQIKDKKVDKLEFVKKSKYFDKIFTEEQQENIDNVDKNEINRIYYWINQTAIVKCKILREFLDTKDLLFEDRYCGKSQKVKKEEKEEEKEKEKKKKEKEEKKAKKELEKEKLKEAKKKEAKKKETKKKEED